MSTISRKSNIELLRLVLMLLVVLLHFNNETMGGAFVFVRNYPVENFVLHFFKSSDYFCNNGYNFSNKPQSRFCR